jgi:arylsulfatase A-like enzyme
MVLNVDLAPTVLELAGVPVPKDMEGRSYRGLLAGESVRNWRRGYRYEYFCSSWGLPDFDGVRTADGWKYCRYPEWEQLFNLREDPTEVRNLASLPKYAAKKKELIAELARLGGGSRTLRGPCPYQRRSSPTHEPHPPGFEARP